MPPENRDVVAPGNDPQCGVRNRPVHPDRNIHREELVPVSVYDQRACSDGAKEGRGEVHIVIGIPEAGELARQLPDLRIASSGNSVVAPISTMASIRSRCCVAMWSRVMPPVLMPIALKRVTPS